jgi:hypothetical protein
MWNFAGKQNDIQGHGGILHGNWISGISWIDELRLGNQSKLPDYFKNQKSRNTYFFLPLILGLIGMIYQYKKSSKQFLITLLLFLSTGLAIVVYLNEVPSTPRERDYIFVGSFFTFSIWIGLGMLGMVSFLKKIIKKKPAIISAVFLSLMASPLLLAFQNYDDHDRSNRYTTRDMAFNYLDSCEQNAILFTAADNDTYPLWYAQEVENHRKDMRLILVPYLGSSWYIEQMKVDRENDPAIPINFEKKDFFNHKRIYLPVIDRIKDTPTLSQVLSFVKSEDTRTKVGSNRNHRLNYIPTKRIRWTVNKENVKDSGIITETCEVKIPEKIIWKINTNNLYRKDLMVLEILARNNWERPVYFTNPNTAKRLGLEQYIQREGFVYKLMPFKDNVVKEKLISSQEWYKNLMNDFDWGNMDKKNVHLDWHNIISITSMQLPIVFSDIANKLTNQGDEKKADKLLDHCMNLMRKEYFPYDYQTLELIKSYYKASYKKKGDAITIEFQKDITEWFSYFDALNRQHKKSLNREIRTRMYYLKELTEISKRYKRKISGKLEEKLYKRISMYRNGF